MKTHEHANTDSCPEEIQEWLLKIGWYCGRERIAWGPTFQREGVKGLFTWQDAVCYEFYRFLNIGAH